MTKVPVYSLEGKPTREVNLAQAFQTDVRVDVIKKVFLAEQANSRQPYGLDPFAGQRSSAHFHGRRHTRWGMNNKEMARMRRIHNQGYMNFTARVVPQAVKGRKAHPPKAEKNWSQKINKKERLFAIKSAISAASSKTLVTERGHKASNLILPLVLEDKFEGLKTTKLVEKTLLSLGLSQELERSSIKKVRAGRGKMRGRRYRIKKGPLIIIGKDEGIKKAARNILGVDVVEPRELSLSLLAPGGHPGRLTIFTKSAVDYFNGL